MKYHQWCDLRCLKIPQNPSNWNSVLLEQNQLTHWSWDTILQMTFWKFFLVWYFLYSYSHFTWNFIAIIRIPALIKILTWVHFLSLTQSKLRLCLANHRPGYFSNLACDWLSIVWAYSEQETENGPWCRSGDELLSEPMMASFNL